MSHRNKATESHFADRVSSEVDKKIRGLAGLLMDEVKDTMSTASAKIQALDKEQCALAKEQCALASKLDILVDNSLHHGSTLDSISITLSKISQQSPLVSPTPHVPLASSGHLPSTPSLPRSSSQPSFGDLRGYLSGSKRSSETSPWIKGSEPPARKINLTRTVVNPSSQSLPPPSPFLTPISPSSSPSNFSRRLAEIHARDSLSEDINPVRNLQFPSPNVSFPPPLMSTSSLPPHSIQRESRSFHSLPPAPSPHSHAPPQTAHPQLPSPSPNGWESQAGQQSWGQAPISRQGSTGGNHGGGQGGGRQGAQPSQHNTNPWGDGRH